MYIVHFFVLKRSSFVRTFLVCTKKAATLDSLDLLTYERFD
jgi:hypothetical protein